MRDATILTPHIFPTNRISIHASHAGCDPGSFRPGILLILFQSTHPMRDATAPQTDETEPVKISIHASHAGCDLLVNIRGCNGSDFNPRIPCGMRPPIKLKNITIKKFQSTHPMRDATSRTGSRFIINLISIHASHAGCDTHTLAVIYRVK